MHCPFGKDKWKTATRKRAAKKWMAKSGRHFSLAVLPVVCFSVLQVICSSLGSCIHLSEKPDLSQQCILWLFRYLGFFEKKVSGKVWCGVGIAVVGLYLLCMTESGFSVQKGDFLLMLCALAFSLHILVIDYFSPKADGVKLSCIQFFYLWNPVWCRDGSDGKPQLSEYSCCMDANLIRRCHVLRRGIYPADSSGRKE